jgi:signal transduction histidine kinase
MQEQRHSRRGWHDPSPEDDVPDWGVRVRRRRRHFHGDGGPLRRDPVDRLAGGVAAGLGARLGIGVTTVRILLVVAFLFTQGWIVPVYAVGWLVIPPRDSDTSIWSRARHDSRGVAVAAALGSLLVFFMLIVTALNEQLFETYGWPQVVSVACLALIWRNAGEGEQRALRGLIQPLEGLGVTGGRHRVSRATALRFAASAVLLAVGVGWLLSEHESLAMLRPLTGLVLIAAAVVLLLGPWWLRIARDLVLERQARARAEERADIASRVHDSVLQTLALIQHRAEDPQAVVQLARAQERELRSWLFEGRSPGDTDVTSLVEGIREIQRDVEARHLVPVEVVTVGDCTLDEHLGALLAAAREATVNAAKWSGANVISVFAEVEPDRVVVTVRDRGKGFDTDGVPEDRKGVAESIFGRMARHGGEATVQSAPGEGTKVTLTMPRTAQESGYGAQPDEARR